jgi:hypothetical protein
MLEEIIKILIEELLIIFSSVQFGSVSITAGGVLYVPTGSKIGKIAVITGLIVLTINAFVF